MLWYLIFFSYRENLIIASQNGYIVDIIRTVLTIVQNIVQCIILIITRNFILYLVIHIIITLLINIVIYYKSTKMYPFLKEKEVFPLDKETKNRMHSNVKAIFISTVSSKLINSTDNILITALGGIVQTGLNSNYVLISATLIAFTNKLCAGIRAGIGDAVVHKTDYEKIKLHDEIHFVFFWFFGFCSICYIFLSQDVVALFFGEKYVLDFAIPLITGLNMYIYHEYSYNDSFLQGMGLFKPIKYLNIVTGTLNIVLSIVLGKLYGTAGILAATFISQLLTYRWYVPYVLYKFGFKSNVLHYFKRDLMYAAQYASIIFLIYIICKLVNFTGVLGLFVHMVICVVIVNLVIVLFNFRKEEFRKFTQRMYSIVSKKK